ncbi:MAG: efflux RND transporter periplasmic adaptor subunit [Flavipsychrobacter sp.]
MNRNLAIIASVLLISLGLVSCGGGKKDNKAGMPTPVNIITVQKQSVEYHDQYPGNTVALSQVDLHAEVEGYITGIYFKEGDFVHKGQKLYTIDQSKYMASYDQAAANVKVAQANEAQAKKDADRYLYLNEHDAIAKQTLDHALTTLQNSKNQVSAAKQDLIKAQTDLRFATIVAPFDGIIGLSQVKLGTLVTPGQTVLNTISTEDPMAVDFVINEKQLPHFLQLLNKKPSPADSVFTMILPDNTEYASPGQISVVDRGVDPLTGTIKVRLIFPNGNGQLRAGMSCQVRVRNQNSEPQIVIPSKATIEQMGEYFVYVAVDTVLKNEKGEHKDHDAHAAAGPPPMKAVQKKVLLGETVGPNVIVKSGLEEGEQLIVDGIQKVHDGGLVSPGHPNTAAADSMNHAKQDSVQQSNAQKNAAGH